MRGVYALILELSKKVYTTIGRPGAHRLNLGFYIYIGKGSGKGSSSVEARLKRHFSKDKRPFWHIDYLTLNPQFTAKAAVSAATTELSECYLTRLLLRELEAELAIKGFGSSDCKCGGHLIYVSSGSLKWLVGTVYAVFLKLKLKPRVIRIWNHQRKVEKA